MNNGDSLPSCFTKHNKMNKKGKDKLEELLFSYCAVPEKIHTHPMEGHLKFLGGGWVLKVKILEGKYEAKLEFPGGGGCKTKNLPWGEYGYFLELHIDPRKRLRPFFSTVSLVRKYTQVLNNSCHFVKIVTTLSPRLSINTLLLLCVS